MHREYSRTQCAYTQAPVDEMLEKAGGYPTRVALERGQGLAVREFPLDFLTAMAQPRGPRLSFVQRSITDKTARHAAVVEDQMRRPARVRMFGGCGRNADATHERGFRPDGRREHPAMGISLNFSAAP